MTLRETEGRTMIGIIAAMKVEAEGLIREMKYKRTRVISGVEFTRGKLRGKDAVVCVCGVGKVRAAVCAEAMATNYKPDCIINTGVAGNLSKELGIGDIAIGKDAVQHDFDTTAFGDPRGGCFIDGKFETYFKCDRKLVKLVEKAAKAEGLRSVKGTVATGDCFVAGNDKKDEIRGYFPTAVCCEMEGGAIAVVSFVNKIPFAIVRAISDSADGESPENFSGFLEQAAGNSIRVIMRVVEEL